ncbi:hypothetical protein GCM10011608_49440 [Micromonospora sonchi]|uniref:Uncharacterized protein n=1 Tax=Micromonospora sonchi TaxID=1763543 RepID=A0A917X1K1_9ACTN|nr:hypothetical protein GCM10011608_49440 [Micromonospora sonchi]
MYSGPAIGEPVLAAAVGLVAGFALRVAIGEPVPAVAAGFALRVAPARAPGTAGLARRLRADVPSPR